MNKNDNKESVVKYWWEKFEVVIDSVNYKIII